MFRYRGSQSFSRDEVYLLNVEDGRLLCLSPLLFWLQCEYHPGAAYGVGHLYVFDKYDERTRGYSFKAVGYPCSTLITSTDQYAAIYSAIAAMMVEDPSVSFIESGTFEVFQT
jgi:hypothetical protein